jgi:hypothetical protein
MRKFRESPRSYVAFWNVLVFSTSYEISLRTETYMHSYLTSPQLSAGLHHQKPEDVLPWNTYRIVLDIYCSA